MDRNLLLAIVLSVAIIVGFQLYFQKTAKHKGVKPIKPATTEETIGKARPSPKPAEKTPTGTAEVSKEKKPHLEPTREVSQAVEQPQQPEQAEAAKKRVVINSPQYVAVLSSLGAQIVSFKLKKYKKTLEGPELVNMVSDKTPNTAGPSIMLTGQDKTVGDKNLVYVSDEKADKITLTDRDGQKSITFRAKTADGLILIKKYTFHADTYAVDVTFSFLNKSGAKRNYLVTFPWKKVYRQKEEEKDRYAWNSAEIFLNNEVKDIYFHKVDEDRDYSGDIKWVGLGDTYFLKCLAPNGWRAHKVTLFKPSADGFAELWLRAGSMDLSPGGAGSLNLLVYLGPKEHAALQKAGHDLVRALFYSSYFVFDIMAQYLMDFLRICHYGFTVVGLRIPGTGNWGWDIILLTVIIKILFIPLTHKQVKSMKRMQDLQPKIAELKAKHKDDKQAQNQAMMQLFKEHNVNPLGSCWPMFLQLPVFIALYQALLYAIELRHAGFVCIPSIYLCLKDLSAPDPYYVTPIIMGGSMVLQQWLTPSTGDPTQRKMMMIMPVVFTYIFLSFPSGLVLYWLVSNLLSIGQQVMTNALTK